MPVGTAERAFAAAAEDDGIVLSRARVPWLNQRGHLGLPDEASAARAHLARIFDALGGHDEEQAAKRLTSLPGDFFHEPTGTFIEIDEFQHFTTHRRRALELYPASAPLGFDRDSYLALCDELASRADKYRASKAAVGFGDGGRQRQRAYHDALRDLAAPDMGAPPVMRFPVLDGDGAGAYERARAHLRHLRP